MKVVNTSKSIYNTVLMIVTINILVIPPIPNLTVELKIFLIP